MQITKFNHNYWPAGWSTRSSIMGVLNLTPDSFSDGGLYNSPDLALKQAKYLVDNGADIIDIGGQSTRPGAKLISEEVELSRVIPALLKIREKLPEIIISVDTFNSNVAYKAISLGANWVNDISGGTLDDNMLEVVSKLNCPYILMHSRGNSLTMNKLNIYKNLLSDVRNELLLRTDKALKAGIQPNKIIWDPGLGFAKNTNQNIEIIKNLDLFKREGYPLLVGPSRKSFIGDLLKEDNPKKRVLGTVVVTCKCIESHVDVIRIHDIKEIKQTLNIANILWPNPKISS